jgi:dTDP-4-amino-4,6-dideoxygalactose transaminase
VRTDFLPFALPDVGPEEYAAVQEVLQSGWITTGPKAAQFEAEFAEYVGSSFSVALNSCTAALHLALEAIGVAEGDEVVTSPYTFAATAEVVRYLRATPVFVDVERTSLNLDPQGLEAAITPRTKAILPVHIAGQPAALAAIYSSAAKHGLAVIEDSAHALPARVGDRMIGADLDRGAYPGLGPHATCFSFYATKCLTTGEGGMLCTDSAELARRARLMSLHGLSGDAWKRYSATGSWYYEIEAPGYKYNMGDIAAALGLVQLRRLEEMWRRRCQVAEVYREELGDCEAVELPFEQPGTQHAWHLFALRLNLEQLACDRAVFIDELKRHGVGASVHFIPLHLHPYYRDLYGYRPDDLPVAHREYLREVSLPIHSRMTEDDARYAARAVRRVVEEKRKKSCR